ncbi:MAG: C10 family peptidase, partial [Muribaculaceae bacterium]|nr:C10 family peptidase [Muribaculaceae bacterium]
RLVSEICIRDSPNTTWVLYSEDREPGVDPVPHFVGIAATVEKQSYTPKGGRLKTQWNQMGNYNMFMPFRNDSSNIHAIVGCGAIAAAQMIYHSNKYFGVPATTETMATYNPEINRYEFSVPSSNVWSLMDSGENEHFCADPVKMIPTAIFLGNVARLIKTEYQTDYTNESSSKPRNIIPILSKMLNVQFSDDNLNWTAIVSTLKKGYPVFTTSYNNIFDSQKLKGHGYLIDKADFYSENLYDVYDIRISDNNPDIEDTEDHNEIEDSPEYVAHSLDYYRAVYGDIEYWPKSTIVEHWLMMNWGVEKYLNEVMVNADESILKISATKFDTNIIYKVN